MPGLIVDEVTIDLAYAALRAAVADALGLTPDEQQLLLSQTAG